MRGLTPDTKGRKREGLKKLRLRCSKSSLCGSCPRAERPQLITDQRTRLRAGALDHRGAVAPDWHFSAGAMLKGVVDLP